MPKRIIGYTDEISVEPGETLSVKLSAFEVDNYTASVVRLIHGDLNPDGPGFKSEPLASVAAVEGRGREQYVHAGSYALVDAHPALSHSGSFTVLAFVWPTTPLKGEQSIISTLSEDASSGYELGLDNQGRLQFLLPGGNRIVTNSQLVRREWYLVAAVWDAESGTAAIYQSPISRGVQKTGAHASEAMSCSVDTTGRPLLIAAREAIDKRDGKTAPTHHYNGKVERPRVFSRALSGNEIWSASSPTLISSLRSDLIADWDFTVDIPTEVIRDRSPHGLDGRLVHLPTRAMKGVAWTGESMSWSDRPEHYGAIHFHDDDVYDADWDTDFQVTIPEDTRSGIYAVHVEGDGAEDYIPFAVRPGAGSERADIVFVMPTMSYLAYANEHMPTDAPLAQLLTGQVVPLQEEDLFLAEHREYGGSTYDVHSDGSGICYSSRLRPILNMRPKYAMWLGGSGSALWQFNADLHITDWLEEQGHRFDVITDEDLHREGYAALAPYRVAITGTHAEYTTETMRDAYEEFTHRAGRLIYMGGNGFYWRTSYISTLPGVMEIRKGEGGIRAWAAEPGEYYNAFTGEYSGLWRRSGRPPQQLVGVGFIAQGFDVSAPYHRTEGSYDPRAKFIFEGIEESTIGDFGLIGGGAAGLELDHADRDLGTPPHALTLATSSGGHSDVYMVVLEEILINHPGLTGPQSDLVGADLVFFEMPGGGAVFSTGSIAFCGSLSWNSYDNNISKLMDNVVRRFSDPEPFVVPEQQEWSQ